MTFSSNENEERFLGAMERLATAFEAMASPPPPPEPTPEEVEERELDLKMRRQSYAQMQNETKLAKERARNEWARLRAERSELERRGVIIEDFDESSSD